MIMEHQTQIALQFECLQSTYLSISLTTFSAFSWNPKITITESCQSHATFFYPRPGQTERTSEWVSRGRWRERERERFRLHQRGILKLCSNFSLYICELDVPSENEVITKTVSSQDFNILSHKTNHYSCNEGLLVISNLKLWLKFNKSN